MSDFAPSEAKVEAKIGGDSSESGASAASKTPSRADLDRALAIAAPVVGAWRTRSMAHAFCAV